MLRIDHEVHRGGAVGGGRMPLVSLVLLALGCGSSPSSEIGVDFAPDQHSHAVSETGGLVIAAEPRPFPSEPAASPACERGGLSMTVTAAETDVVTAHTTITYDIAVTNRDAVACDARALLIRTAALPAEFAFFVSPTFGLSLPGDVLHFMASLTATTEAIPGPYALPFEIFDPATSDVVSGVLDYQLGELPTCVVRPSRELFLTDLSVVEDPTRTMFASEDDPRASAWTFGRLMENAAPTANDAPDMVEAFFDTWRSDQTVNGQLVAARPAIDPLLLTTWPRSADGRLDLTKSPLRLLAIVNRMDARSLANGHAGQGRFVFGVLDPGGARTPFTVILEYRLPATTTADVLTWAASWHELGALPFPSESFNARLQTITDRFTRRAADPSGINGSALATVRTDDASLNLPWELRQFRLGRADGRLQPTTVDRTPDARWNATEALATFINHNERAILADRDVVPRQLSGSPFLAGSALNQLVAWDAPGIRSPLARREFSLQTCNGCHAAPETGTEFVHVGPRDRGTASRLSGFLLGISMPDPVTGERRTFNDLARRKADLEHLVCECGSRRWCRASEGIGRDY